MSPDAAKLLGLAPHVHAAPHAALPWIALLLASSILLPQVREYARAVAKRLRAEPPPLFFIAAWLLGTALRLSFPGDIEYKADEAWMFHAADGLWRGDPWPLVGMPSSAGLPNPGLSVWVFRVLAWMFGADTPVELARSVAWLNVTALTTLFVFAWWRTREERSLWLWVSALAAVDPLGIILQRKIWAQSVLPIFALMMFFAWRARASRWGAFLWGLLGALIGQLHMSGFVYAGAFALWSGYAYFRRGPQPVRWGYWFAGSLLGVLPCIPWLRVLSRATVSRPAATSVNAWLSWIQDVVGWNLHYSLAPSDIGWLIIPVSIAVVVSTILLLLFVRGLISERTFPGGSTAHNVAFGGYCALMQILPVPFFRHYLLVAFPFESMTLPLVAGKHRWGLAIVWAAHAVTAAGVLWYLHVNGGSPDGDFGLTYQFQLSHY